MLQNALSGIKVIDLTHMAAGPTCTMLLADLGADVIKVEPRQGDFARNFGPSFQNGQSNSFMALNRDKRSVSLDLKDDQDAAALHDLTGEADIFVESFRPGVMRRLGFDYATLSATNPSLIYCSISAFGQNSPVADRPGVDGIMQGISGLMSIIGRAGEAPTKVQEPIVDNTTGYFSALALLAAVIDREKTSRGTYLDISMLDAAIQLQQSSLVSFLASGTVPAASGSAAPYSAPNEAFPTADGWIMVAAYQPDRWIALCEAIDRAELIDHEMYRTMEARIANRPAMHEELSRTLQTRPSAEWLNLLPHKGIMCGPINDYAKLLQDDQLEVTRHIDYVDHPIAGSVPILRSLLSMADLHRDSDKRVRPAPVLGQHDEEIRLNGGSPL